MSDECRMGLLVVALIGIATALWRVFSWLGAVRQRTKRRWCSKELARKAIRQVGLPWKFEGGSTWMAVSPPKHGFRVTLRLTADDGFVIVSADANFHIEREFVDRQLLWMLLEINGRCLSGSFGIAPTKDGHQILHRHACDVYGFSSKTVAIIGQNLIAQLEQVIESVHKVEWV